MVKSGLFLCSIGLLFFVFSGNPQSGSYNVLNMLIGFCLIIAGGILWWMGNKKEKSNKRS